MATISTDANYSDVTYSDNEAFTITQGAKFTLDQSTVDLRNMRCITFGECLVKNTSTTTPMIVSLGSTGNTARWQFTAGGISTIEGEWIVLGTGNGTAGQTFNIPQAQGVNGVGTQDVPVLSGLYIDDNDTLRDGSSIPTLCLEVDSASYTNATDHERGGNVFTFDSVAQTVTFKRAVPVGKSVVMPNIIFYTSSNFTGATEFDLLVSQTGTFNWDKCLWSGKFDFTLTSGKKITLKNCAFNTDLVNKTFGLNSQVEPPLLENVIIKGDCSTVSLLSLSNSASAGSLKNLWVDCSHIGESNPVNSQNSSSLHIQKLVTTNYLGGTLVAGGNNSRAVINVTSGNSTFYDIYNFIPQQTIFLGANASNCKVDNVKFQFGSREDATGQTNCGAIRLANCNGNVVTNVEQIKAGPIYPYGNALLCAAGTADNTIANVVLRSGASGSGNNRWNYAANDSGFQNRYNNFVMHGYYKTAFYNNGSASLEAFVSNFYAVDQQNEHNVDLRVGARCRIEQFYLNNTQNSGNGNFDAAATASGVDSLSVMGIRNTADGGAIEKTDGLFYLRMSPTEEQTSYFTAVTQTGVIVFNNNNIMYIENSGDVVELESFVHNNVSAISSDLTKQGSGTGSFDVTVKMRRPEGVYTSYVATTQSDMQTAYTTLPSDAENRVQFKFRIEKTATNLTQYLQGLRFDVTLTGDDYPFVLDPGIINVEEGGVYSVDAGTKFLVDTSVVTTFTIDGIIPKEIELTGVGSTTVLGVNNAKLTTTNITGTGTLVRGDGLNPSTNWTVVSDVLTLSSGTTETDLLGLRGLGIVDYAKVGSSYAYTINGRLEINGTLFIDPETEQLVFTEEQPTPQAVLLPTGGVLTVGDTNSAPVYPKGSWLKVARRGSKGWAASDNFSVRVTGGTINLYGGSMSVASPFRFDSGTFNSLEQEIILLPSLDQNARFLARAATNFSNLELYNNGVDIGSAGAGATFDNIIIYNADPIGIHPCYDQMELVNYDYVVGGAIFPFASIDTDSKTIFARNFAKGTSGGYGTSILFGNNTTLSDLVLELSKDLSFNFKDTSGANLEGVQLYSIERDNSGTNYSDWDRNNDNRAVTVNGVDYATPLATNATSDVNGDIILDNFRFAVAYQRNIGVKEVVLCRFTKSADDTDVHDFLFYLYGKLVSSTDVSLQGVGTTNVDWILVDDLVITETNKTTVDAYTELETPEKFYDRASSFLEDSFGSYTDFIVTRSGSLITTDSYNVSLDTSYSNTLDIVSPTPDATIAKGSNVNLELISSDITVQDAAIHCEFTTGSDVTTGQIIWEAGGSTIGTVLAIESGVFKIYAGSTGSEQSNTVSVSPNTKYSSTVVIDLTNDEIRFYLNANSKKPTKSHLVDSVSFTENKWSGNNSVGVGEDNNGARSPFTGSFLGLIKNNSIYVYQTNEVSDTLDTIEIKTSSFSGDMTAGGVITVSSSVTFSGVRTDQNGSVFPTRYVTLTNVPLNAEVRIYDEDNDGNTNTLGVDREGVETSSSSTYVMPHDYQESGNSVIVQILALGYEELTFTITLTTENQSFNLLERLIVEENL